MKKSTTVFLLSAVAICIALILCSCASAISQPASDALTAVQKGAVYKYDLSGTVNGVAFDGVGVIPFAQSYSMSIVSKVNVDLLTVTSCGRDFSVESAVKLGWFQSQKGYTYNYIPDDTIENKGSCLVRMGTYNRDKGQNSWGIIDFETPETILPAVNYCNGITSSTNGVSICQSKIGLIQRLVFTVPVQTAKNSINPNCQMTSKDGLSWEYVLPAGECVLEFQEVAAPHRRHRHTTIAYTDILIRGNQ